MSPREKKLLILFASAGFIVLNFLGFGFYQRQSLAALQSRDQAKQQLQTAKMIRSSSDQVVDEMAWLAEHEPEPAANQDVQTTLQQLCEREAKGLGLEIRKQSPLPTDTTSGTHFHRARIQLTVSGAEDALYRWFDRLNVPDALRATTHIRLSPNAKEDTKIDCTATVEQWFVPVTSS
jgi:hypothetical protein